MIDKRYSWILGKDVLSGVDGRAFVGRMAAEGLFNGFEDIICIGAASREYQNLPREDKRTLEHLEDQRSWGRANVLGRWVRDAVPPSRAHVYGLKIGRYNDEGRLTPAETARERQVVIVGVFQDPTKTLTY